MQKVTGKIFLIWLLLNVFIAIFMDLAFFAQTTLPEGTSFIKKLGISELIATIEWMFVIPANRIGNKFFTAAQISLSSYIFDFLGQIGTNMFWLKLPTTVDDYAAMVLIMVGMIISSYKLFG